MSNLQIGTIMSASGNVTNVLDNNSSKTDVSFTDTYDEAILRANALDVNLLAYVSETGEIPKFVVPYDLGHSTDYTTTLATPERLQTTDYYNSLLGFGGYVEKPVTVSSSVENHNNTVASAPAKETLGLSVENTILTATLVNSGSFVENVSSKPETDDTKFTDARSAIQNWRSAKANLTYSKWIHIAQDISQTI